MPEIVRRRGLAFWIRQPIISSPGKNADVSSTTVAVSATLKLETRKEAGFFDLRAIQILAGEIAGETPTHTVDLQTARFFLSVAFWHGRMQLEQDDSGWRTCREVRVDKTTSKSNKAA